MRFPVYPCLPTEPVGEVSCNVIHGFKKIRWGGLSTMTDKYVVTVTIMDPHGITPELVGSEKSKNSWTASPNNYMWHSRQRVWKHCQI